MNIQLILAGLPPQQDKSGVGATAETGVSDSFATILSQTLRPHQEAMAAIKGEVALPSLPLHSSAAFKAILDSSGQLSAELAIDDLESELPTTDLGLAAPVEEAITEEGALAVLNPDLTQQVQQSQAAASNAVNAGQDAKQGSAVVADNPLAARAAAAASPQANQPVAAEGEPKLTVEPAELAAKPAAQSNLETSALQAANSNSQALSAGAAARPVLTAPLASPQWQNDLSQQVSSFALRGDGRVSLQLNPSDLGPLLVELKIVEQSAQVQFVSGQAAVRSAVEQAIPQLRDALAEQGIDLGDVNVGEHSRQQEQSPSTHRSAMLNGTEGETEAAELTLNEVTVGGTPLPGQLSIYV